MNLDETVVLILEAVLMRGDNLLDCKIEGRQNGQDANKHSVKMYLSSGETIRFKVKNLQKVIPLDEESVML